MSDTSKRVCYVMIAIFIEPFFQGKEKEIFDSPGTNQTVKRRLRSLKKKSEGVNFCQDYISQGRWKRFSFPKLVFHFIFMFSNFSPFLSNVEAVLSLSLLIFFFILLKYFHFANFILLKTIKF